MRKDKITEENIFLLFYIFIKKIEKSQIIIKKS